MQIRLQIKQKIYACEIKSVCPRDSSKQADVYPENLRLLLIKIL
jgi:hypothetical protein